MGANESLHRINDRCDREVARLQYVSDRFAGYEPLVQYGWKLPVSVIPSVFDEFVNVVESNGTIFRVWKKTAEKKGEKTRTSILRGISYNLCCSLDPNESYTKGWKNVARESVVAELNASAENDIFLTSYLLKRTEQGSYYGFVSRRDSKTMFLLFLCTVENMNERWMKLQRDVMDNIIDASYACIESTENEGECILFASSHERLWIYRMLFSAEVERVEFSEYKLPSALPEGEIRRCSYITSRDEAFFSMIVPWEEKVSLVAIRPFWKLRKKERMAAKEIICYAKGSIGTTIIPPRTDDLVMGDATGDGFNDKIFLLREEVEGRTLFVQPKPADFEYEGTTFSVPTLLLNIFWIDQSLYALMKNSEESPLFPRSHAYFDASLYIIRCCDERSVRS